MLIEIPETDLGFVRDGAAARIHADALPDRVFEGQVTLLQSKLEKTQRVFVEVQLPNRDRLLVPGMKVEVTLESGLMRLPVRANGIRDLVVKKGFSSLTSGKD